MINTGIAGSLNADINIGDIVVSTDLIHHDMNAVAFGYPVGQIPQMEAFSFHSDDALRALAVKACKEANPDIEVFEDALHPVTSLWQTRVSKILLQKNLEHTLLKWKARQSHRQHI